MDLQVVLMAMAVVDIQAQMLTVLHLLVIHITTLLQVMDRPITLITVQEMGVLELQEILHVEAHQNLII